MSRMSELEDLFEQNLNSVEELIAFDKLVLDKCIDGLEQLNERLKRGPFSINNPSYLAENTLKTIKNIRYNDSLKGKYASMYNSCLVLQVSYLSSILDDIFRHVTGRLFPESTQQGVDFQERRKKNDINFQNMPSTVRTYKKFLDIEITIDSVYNTIVLAQEARHAIVHTLGFVNEKFIKQAEAAKPRDIKQAFALNDKVAFSQSELQYVKMAMQTFVSNLCSKIRSKYINVN